MAGREVKQPDAAPEIVRQYAERAKIRKALRLEYLRKATDPSVIDGHIFDPVMQRYYAMHMTVYDRFVPHFKGFCTWMGLVVLPITCLALYYKKTRNELERQCATGELKYEQRLWKTVA